ncbi:MAG: FAD-dependent 5-carboxymethylaminomethyl-2-thiouridine(34) oxidoreductase MnmC [Pseudomonadota bacterium]
MRLPPRPDLSWKEDGTPVDERVGDVYYSVEDGLAESRAVFLAGCGLPEAWQYRSQFTIAELGFGTGLNFLAAWQMWRETKPQDGWLNFVSFEGFLLDAEDVARALKPWPELADLAAKLSAKWPPRAKGVRRITWPEERLSLTLHIGLIEDTLPQAQFHADAWFLDGFSPAKNATMWGNDLWPLMAERSAPGARAATFTVAGAVRRGLNEAGFRPEKKPGHGRKRERLEATFDGPDVRAGLEPVAAPKVAILGAGIAGACVARTLTERGARVTVFERDASPAQGTSGNPLALVMPRLDAADTVQARLLIDAYLSAQAFYEGQPGAVMTETVHTPRNQQETERFQRLLADPPLGLEQLEAIRGGGLLHKKSLLIEPAKLLPALLQGIDVRWQTEGAFDPEDRTVNGEAFDAIILSTGWHLGAVLPELDLTGRLGQIEWFHSDVTAPPAAQASGHYALALEHTRLWGATYADLVGPMPEVTEQATKENLSALQELAPYWLQNSRSAELRARAGVRATTADRLPLIGALPNQAEMELDRQRLERSGWNVSPEAFARPGMFMAAGFGSRGFTWGPWAAQILTARIFNDPLPARRDALKMIVPNRQILRKLKRSKP